MIDQTKDLIEQVHHKIKKASNIEELTDKLDQIERLMYDVRRFDIKFLPENLRIRVEKIDEWEDRNEEAIIYFKALNSWQNKWENAHEKQFPQHIIVPIYKGLYPFQSIILGLLAANIRTMPMMMTILTERNRLSFVRALKELVQMGYIFKVSASMYFESHWDREDAKKWAKNYIKSNRSPQGVIPRMRNYDFDEHATKITRIMRKTDGWHRVSEHPDENEDYKKPWKYSTSALKSEHIL